MSDNIGTTIRFSDGRQTVLDETAAALAAVAEDQWDAAGIIIASAPKVFAVGSGRSGLAIQMAAMRLMHLGLKVHVAGEVTAPAIGAGDVLIAVSGSGTTASVVRAADIATAQGAAVIAVTTSEESPLAIRASHVLLIAGADKQDHSGNVSRQYAGSMFEQAVLLSFDALFESLRSSEGQTPDQLWTRHANIG